MAIQYKKGNNGDLNKIGCIKSSCLAKVLVGHKQAGQQFSTQSVNGELYKAIFPIFLVPDKLVFCFHTNICCLLHIAMLFLTTRDRTYKDMNLSSDNFFPLISKQFKNQYIDLQITNAVVCMLKACISFAPANRVIMQCWIGERF